MSKKELGFCGSELQEVREKMLLRPLGALKWVWYTLSVGLDIYSQAHEMCQWICFQTDAPGRAEKVVSINFRPIEQLRMWLLRRSYYISITIIQIDGSFFAVRERNRNRSVEHTFFLSRSGKRSSKWVQESQRSRKIIAFCFISFMFQQVIRRKMH